jgi:uncharacterized protein (DUF1330 family)
MAFYFVAQIDIRDHKEYDKYLDGFDNVFSRFRGEFLAIDESPVLLEGKWAYTKSVLIRFNTKKDFDDWYYSDDYQEILRHRLKAAKCDTILVEGVE